MPTFREDVRLGTKVPQLKTEDYNDKSVTAEKIADGAIEGKKIALNSVETKHIADSAVTRKKLPLMLLA